MTLSWKETKENRSLYCKAHGADLCHQEARPHQRKSNSAGTRDCHCLILTLIASNLHQPDATRWYMGVGTDNKITLVHLNILTKYDLHTTAQTRRESVSNGPVNNGHQRSIWQSTMAATAGDIIPYEAEKESAMS